MAGEKKKQSKKGAAGQVIEGQAEEVKKKKQVGPIKFLQQVRDEAYKVTWTTRNEMFISTAMVLTMVVIMALFFLIVDQTIQFGVCQLLPIDCASSNS
ncbi:MAG: preprotein translocase subunit SecE [Parvularculaceae bacterium]|nr:preprotein translocase subunit SecE [Parvularculaceae bacterium]